MDFRCNIVPEPHQEAKAVFRQTSTEQPYFNGDDYDGNFERKVRYVCGKCNFVLAKNIHIDQIKQLVRTDKEDEGIIFQCPKCLSFNELNSKLHSG